MRTTGKRVALLPRGTGSLPLGDEEVEDEEPEGEDEETEEISEIEDENLPFQPEEIAEWELRHATRRGSESTCRLQRLNQFYPIYIDVDAKRVVLQAHRCRRQKTQLREG